MKQSGAAGSATAAFPGDVRTRGLPVKQSAVGASSLAAVVLNPRGPGVPVKAAVASLE